MEGKTEKEYLGIDAHVHLYPNGIAEKVVKTLSERFGNAPSFDGTVEGCKTKDAAAKIAISINLPVATKPDSVGHTNEFWAPYAPRRASAALSARDGAQLESSPRVVSLACFHPLVKNKKEELARIVDLGFTGIKFHPEYQLFRFNDSAMDEVWSFMSERKIVAYLHAGGERVFQPPYHSSPKEILRLKERFPKRESGAAPLGGFGMWDEAEEVLAGSDVYLDLSHTFFWMKDEQIMRFIGKHGARKILFGSDAPWQDPGSVLKAFLKLDLAPENKKMILYENALRLFSL